MAPKTDFPPVRACLFDMDGLLLNSEDLYTESANIILHEHGRGDFPWSLKAQMQGLPGPAATKLFYDWAKLPITIEQLDQRQQEVRAKIFPSAAPLPGTDKLLKDLAGTTAPRVHIAVATSSARVGFDLKTGHLEEYFEVFPKERIITGDDTRIPKGQGKPAPFIYLVALAAINEGIIKEGKEEPIKPEECLVFEDAVPGVEAGRRAGMRVVWCPHPLLLKELKGREKEVLAGLTGQLERNGTLNASAEAAASVTLHHKPGFIDDGWAELLETLEDFPYERYGINVK